MPAALKKLPKPTWPESSVPPGRRRASQQPPRTPPAGAARTSGGTALLFSVFSPLLCGWTALRSAGLQQGSGSQTDPAEREEESPNRLLPGRSCAARETSQSAGRSTNSSSSSDRSRAFIYTGSSSAHFLLPHLGRTSAAGDGLNPV